MEIYWKKAVCVRVVLITGLFIAGCGEPVQIGVESTELAPEINLGTTIGSLAEVASPKSIPVEGYGLVGELSGTGSSECPPQIRAYLRQYILAQLPERKMDVEEFISSRNTSVVEVHGIMPAAVSKNQYFDVRVVSLPGTQTTSLEGGWLYGADLKMAGSFGITTKVLADAEGPVFIDTIEPSETSKKVGYILAGGTVLDTYKIRLALQRPDYRVANIIRNRLVRATYLVETPQITRERIRTFVRKLAASEDKEQSEIALEMIGNEILDKVAALLNSSDSEVRLRAARCMLNLGDDRGLNTLREIAMDKGSFYRVEALEAITAAASRNDASAISRRLLRDDDFDIRLAAYASLRKLDDIAVTQKLIARNFYLEQITQTKHKGIFVSRSGQPRIVLFGAPIYCRDNIFVQSSDGNITINAPAGQEDVTIIRKHPRRPNVIVQLKSSFSVADIIQTLCEEALKKGKMEHRGLGVSYSDTIALLKDMCDKGAVQAEFRAGRLPRIGPIIRHPAGRTY